MIVGFLFWKKNHFRALDDTERWVSSTDDMTLKSESDKLSQTTSRRFSPVDRNYSCIDLELQLPPNGHNFSVLLKPFNFGLSNNSISIYLWLLKLKRVSEHYGQRFSNIEAPITRLQSSSPIRLTRQGGQEPEPKDKVNYIPQTIWNPFHWKNPTRCYVP